MSVAPGQSLPAVVRQAREWQRLSVRATNTAMRHYLRGCANLAMAHTPQLALMELHKMQTGLLRHSVGTIAEVMRLWRKQNAELLRL